MMREAFRGTVEARSVKELYAEFTARRSISDPVIEVFHGTDGCDVYNPSVPFEWEGKTFLAGRVERRESERSEVRFFVRREDGWYPAEGTVRLPLQDPFVSFIGGRLVLGGVHVDFPEGGKGDVRWHTEFYAGTPYRLEYIARGPEQMKDIRLLELTGGKIAVMSRPQGQCMLKYGCISKVGFTVIDSLEELCPEVIENAPYLEKLFVDTEWGGTNQLHLLKNGLIGVIGHKACRTGEGKGSLLHYYGVAFAVDPVTRALTQNEVIISSDCFPAVEPKRSDLADVTFTAGIVRGGDGTARVWTGLSDTHVGSATIPDPFVKYEK